jgi:uncharacterized protein
MILKLLLLAGVIYLVYIFFFKKKGINNSAKEHSNRKKPTANDMIECSSCSLYVEISEAILSNGKYYCSKECLKKDS